jgi:predicted ATPase with chaperone activity
MGVLSELNQQQEAQRLMQVELDELREQQQQGPSYFVPPPLNSLADTGLPELAIEDLLFKVLLDEGVMLGRSLAKELGLPFALLEPLLQELKNRLFLAYKQAGGIGDFLYTLSDQGRERALRAREISAYVGPLPVPYEQYLTAVHAQSIRSEMPQEEDLRRAFEDLVLPEELFNVLGPAVNSGRGLFLYGAPGNGKTSIAERICKAFKGFIFMPHALWIDGQIVLLYDPESHEKVSKRKENKPSLPAYDERWVAVERPVLVVGGELTMEALEIQYNPQLRVSEAPLQMKANNGIFMIDDFGRQRVHHEELLNRWIVPLEKRVDYLTLPSGKKLMVPFDELILFSTNLEPKNLVDEAFLRRIPYKIHVDSPQEPVFRKLLQIMAQKNDMAFPEDLQDYLINTHYKAHNRPFRACQARDLMDQVVNACKYHGKPPELSQALLDQACATYFSVMS